MEANAPKWLVVVAIAIGAVGGLAVAALAAFMWTCAPYNCP